MLLSKELTFWACSGSSSGIFYCPLPMNSFSFIFPKCGGLLNSNHNFVWRLHFAQFYATPFGVETWILVCVYVGWLRSEWFFCNLKSEGFAPPKHNITRFFFQFARTIYDTPFGVETWNLACWFYLYFGWCR